MIRTRIKKTSTRVDGEDVIKYQAQLLDFPAYFSYRQLLWGFQRFLEDDKSFVKRIEKELGAERGTLIFCMRLIDKFYKESEIAAVLKERERLISKSKRTTFIKYPKEGT